MTSDSGLTRVYFYNRKYRWSFKCRKTISSSWSLLLLLALETVGQIVNVRGGKWRESGSIASTLSTFQIQSGQPFLTPLEYPSTTSKLITTHGKLNTIVCVWGGGDLVKPNEKCKKLRIPALQMKCSIHSLARTIRQKLTAKQTNITSYLEQWRMEIF